MNLESLFYELPLLLNSSHSTKEVVELALQKVRAFLNAEAATVFIKDAGSSELTFWVLAGGAETSSLVGAKMPAQKGIVGWVIENNTAQLVQDAHADSRFFANIEVESKYKTRDLICVPLCGRGGKILGALQVLNRKDGAQFNQSDLDITSRIAPILALALENAKLFEELQARTRLLQALDRKKDEMISLIGHEFQTPLNIVLTSSDLLSNGVIKDAAVLAKLAETLTSGVLRLSKCVANIKTISSLSGSPIIARKAPIKLAEIASELQERFSAPLARRSLKLTFSLPEKLSTVSADPILLRVLLSNLISNSIRYTADGGSISVTASESAGLVTIAIIDNGIGIDPRHHEAIFERFYEVTSALHHSSGEFEFRSAGLGLGLPAAKAIAAAHGTKIEVRSAPNAGSTFTLRLATT